jgi:hypothetical protein
MLRRLSAAALVASLGGCAGPILNQYTEYLGPTVGTLEERQILKNLGRFVDNQWAMPGHVELANGQIQATNQLGVNLKYPYTHTAAPSGVTLASGSEFDVNPAQTQDQESYSLLPVTDSDDLRRLRAIYHYAVCPDPKRFAQEWEIADQSIYAPPPAPPKPTPKKQTKQTSKDIVGGLVQDYIAQRKTAAEVEKGVQDQFKTMPLLDATQRKNIEDVLAQTRGAPPLTPDKATDQILEILGPQAVPAAAAATKPGAAKSSTKDNSGTDTIAFEQKRGMFIISPYGLGTSRWLYWRDPTGRISGYCTGSDVVEFPPDPSRLVPLGVAGGHEFFTDDPKKFSDLILFVLGGIPNTTGVHVLDGGVSLGTKNQRTGFVTINGQPAFVNFTKKP